ncbi:Putative DNA-binding domain-containing protein [Nocardioides alpinus]|nr:ATP-binding protein [Nocardioides alpinus]SFA86985.1 Putative DNA-binding domain-containing protein [Nocardioides alpinus]
MAINYSAERLPMGDGEWAALLSAVEASQASDETDWLEHKAGLDPSTKAGGAALAKGIVAFANRAPDQAARWLGGYGLIVVGLEPGHVQGTLAIDPAALHDQIDRYLAPPAPSWDSSQHNYGGQNVLVVTVAPPRYGDPIAVLSKDGTDVINGHIYVRRAGKSEPARHEDLRRLEARLLAGDRSSVEILVEPSGPAVARIAYEPDWIDQWINAERERLLAPLAPPAANDKFASLGRGLAGLESKNFGLGKGTLSALGVVEHEESRSEGEFRDQVEAYLTRAAEALPAALEALRSHHASEHEFVVHNNSTRNYKDLKVQVHIEGAVFGTEYPDDIPDLTELAGKPPREWGPWTEFPKNPLFGQDFAVPMMPHFNSPGFSPSPQIENGGSVTVTFPTFNLRPGESFVLEPISLYADERMTGSTRVTWSATATNVDAVAEGETALTISDAPVVVTSHLR